MTVEQQPIADPQADADPEVTLRLELGRATLAREDLDQLQQGHIVPLDTDPEGDVLVRVGDSVAARGKLVLVNGQICVQLEHVSLDNSVEQD